ncbi:MAG: T9SS type A sorting domain-containing protein [Bacteroidetes bacterium]|nr:T9SS type A sorting domain-containing protein [Bacteroidota bacterium]
MIRNTQLSIGKPLKGFGAYSIANQCPLAGGVAVYRARAMLYLINGYAVYNDKEICNRTGIEMRKGKENIESKFNVFPNPTIDLLTIEYSIEKDCKAKFVVLNFLGQTTDEFNLDNTVGHKTISTTHLNSGVYSYKIDCDGIEVNQGKFIIIH